MQKNSKTEINSNIEIPVDSHSLYVATYFLSTYENLDDSFITKQLKGISNKFLTTNPKTNISKKDVDIYLEKGSHIFSEFLLNAKDYDFQSFINFFLNSFKDFKNQIYFYIYYKNLINRQDELLNKQYHTIINNIDLIYKKTTYSKQVYFSFISKSILRLLAEIPEDNIKNAIDNKTCYIPTTSFVLKIFDKYNVQNENYFIPSL